MEALYRKLETYNVLKLKARGREDGTDEEK